MAKQLVVANQKAVDALALNSGTWRVIGTRGLYVRCRAQSKSFFVRRRVNGTLIDKSIGELSVKQAKDKATREWLKMEKPKPSGDGVTLGVAIEQYLAHKQLAAKTVHLARYNTDHYLVDWKGRTLSAIGNDKPGIRLLGERITKEHGSASSNHVYLLLSAVNRWRRDVDETLPEWPRKAAQIHRIKPRDWEYSPAELRAWWAAMKKK